MILETRIAGIILFITCIIIFIKRIIKKRYKAFGKTALILIFIIYLLYGIFTIWMALDDLRTLEILTNSSWSFLNSGNAYFRMLRFIMFSVIIIIYDILS